MYFFSLLALLLSSTKKRSLSSSWSASDEKFIVEVSKNLRLRVSSDQSKSLHTDVLAKISAEVLSGATTITFEHVISEYVLGKIDPYYIEFKKLNEYR